MDWTCGGGAAYTSACEEDGCRYHGRDDKAFVAHPGVKPVGRLNLATWKPMFETMKARLGFASPEINDDH